jgi:hypothetical protein
VPTADIRTHAGALDAETSTRRIHHLAVEL